jgi:branched-chain amino acid transport system ATP-binding protein
MSAKAIERIREEHRNMGKVLAALRDKAAALSPSNLTSDNRDLLYRMLYYMRVFPHRAHHPKEEDYLFPALRRRAPEMERELDALSAEHDKGDKALKELEESLKVLRSTSGEEVLVRFKDAVQDFVEGEFQHMRHEEEAVLPAAERSLRTEDWMEIDKAFDRNLDPVFNEEVELGFETLRENLLSAGSPNRTG